jgi:hypothetical protein
MNINQLTVGLSTDGLSGSPNKEFNDSKFFLTYEKSTSKIMYDKFSIIRFPKV